MADALRAAIDWRSNTRLESLERKLAQRQADERARITAVIAQFSASLRTAVTEEDWEDTLFSAEITKTTEAERLQYRRDRELWNRRLAGLEAERDRELEVITARYRNLSEHRFPVAVVFVVPKREATR
jgi:hypothetical protein